METPTERRQKRSDDYRLGYSNGYLTGLRRGESRAYVSHTYRRQHWKCLTCDATGMVLFRDDDDEVLKRQRIRASHAAQRRRTHCSSVRLIPLMNREVQHG